MSETPIDAAVEPTDEQLRSDEARRYRQQLREKEEQLANTTARLESVERQNVERDLAGKFSDPRDFWREVDLADVRAEDGTVDPNAIAARAASLLEEHPHWAAPDHSLPGGHLVNSRGVVGGRPRNILDQDNITPEAPARDWATFITQAARGETPPQ
jgi:hypothetical protein